MADSAIGPDAYSAVVTRKDGQFYLFIPEIGVVAHGADLPSAYAELDRKKNELLLMAANLNLERLLVRPGGGPAAAGPASVRPVAPLQELGLFAAKTAIVFVLLAVGALVAGFQVNHGLAALKSRLQTEQLWTRFEGIVLEAADPDTPPDPERQTRLVEALRSLRSRVEPLVAALFPDRPAAATVAPGCSTETMERRADGRGAAAAGPAPRADMP